MYQGAMQMHSTKLRVCETHRSRDAVMAFSGLSAVSTEDKAGTKDRNTLTFSSSWVGLMASDKALRAHTEIVSLRVPSSPLQGSSSVDSAPLGARSAVFHFLHPVLGSQYPKC